MKKARKPTFDRPNPPNALTDQARTLPDQADTVADRADASPALAHALPNPSPAVPGPAPGSPDPAHAVADPAHAFNNVALAKLSAAHREPLARFLTQLREAGLPEPEVHSDGDGQQVDLLWREHKLVVHIDDVI